MVRIVFQKFDGLQVPIQAVEGSSLMQAGVSSGIDEIVAECGGSAMCATCHVYVDDKYVARLPTPNAIESEMLGSAAAERRPNSRLSCQIIVSEFLDGMIVHLPERQI
jgi:2Fe-2S ferredoxin